VRLLGGVGEEEVRLESRLMGRGGTVELCRCGVLRDSGVGMRGWFG